MATLYHINEDYFNQIDNEHKAYWLGFIAADGSIRERDRNYRSLRLTINLSNKDYNHLQKLQHDLSSNIPIKYRSSTDAASFVVTRKKIVEGLIKNGVKKDKTQHLEWPTQLSYILQQHFLRGYFDGDGCFALSIKCKRWLSGYMQVIGNYKFLESMQSFLHTSCDLNIGKIYANHGSKITGFIQWSGNNQFRRCTSFLYHNATIYLQRKFDKVQTINKAIGKEKRKSPKLKTSIASM